MPFPPINLHSRISSPGKELFRKKKPSSGVAVPPQSMLVHKPRSEKDKDMEKEEVDRERERLATSWSASNNLKHLARKQQQQQQHQHHQQHHHHHQQHQHQEHQQQHQVAKTSTDSGGVLNTDGKGSWVTVAKPLGSSCESVPRSSSGESAAASGAAPRGSRHSSRASLGREEAGEQEVRFSLSLTPEAVLVIQKRNLEKQMLAKQQKCCGSADFRHRRVFPSKRAAQGGSKSSAGPGAAAAAGRADGPSDISAIVKISLLNDQHKYDDVEYEEEDGDVDETVMRKCKEWLKGVESAAAFSKVDSKLSALPHLKGC